MNIPRSLALLGAAGALTLAAPAALAHADSPQPRATGTFTFYNNGQVLQTLTDPQDEECMRPASDGIPPYTNHTDAYARIYMLPTCTGPSIDLPPGVSSADEPEFTSIRFWRF